MNARETPILVEDPPSMTSTIPPTRRIPPRTENDMIISFHIGDAALIRPAIE
jgi:hypothetical protein